MVLVTACADKTPAREPSSTANTSSTETIVYSHPSSAQPAPRAQSAAPPTDRSPVMESDSALDHRGTSTGGMDHDVSSVAPATADGKNADNTKNNERDRSGTLTPGNQGNSSSETKITADVRKGLMSSKSLSFTAKNAKIITIGTKVTLRGAVKTDAEKAEIESIAKGTTGVTDVDNQLDVKK
jgi:osmotically-inducible protein OsmY